MAVIDQDNFSNISWHSDRSAGAGASSAAGAGGDDGGEGASNGASRQQRPVTNPEVPLDDPTGFGSETLECVVGSPIKENDGTKDAFVSYLITTRVRSVFDVMKCCCRSANVALQSTFAAFQRPVTTVRRRFTDFVFLYKTLCRDHPECAVPPLPDKQRMEYVRGDRFGADFTSRRAHSLQRFLTRIALHPVLRRSQILHTFLESPDWNATMRSLSVRNASASDPSASGGVIDSLADTFINAFTKVHKPDKRFIEVKERSDRLDEDLSHVEKVVVRVARRETDLEADMKDLAEQFQKLITLEPGVEAAVHAFAASVEDMAAGMKRLKEHTDQDYLGSLRDMVAYSGALKNLLKAREQKQLDHEQLTEYLHKSMLERDQLAAQSGSYGYPPSSHHGGAGSSQSGGQGRDSQSGGGGGPGGASGSSGYGSASTTLTGGLASSLTGASGFLTRKLEDVRGVDQAQSRRERARKLELRIEELSAEVERARTTSALFDEEVVKEVVDFERIKRVEFKRQLSALADAHIDFYTNSIELWERYVAEMEKDMSQQHQHHRGGSASRGRSGPRQPA